MELAVIALGIGNGGALMRDGSTVDRLKATMPPLLGVDEVLTTAKVEIAQAVKTRSQELLDSYGAGIEVVAWDKIALS